MNSKWQRALAAPDSVSAPRESRYNGDFIQFDLIKHERNAFERFDCLIGSYDKIHFAQLMTFD